MLDFMGSEIQPGDWLAQGAKGNTAAQYGMLLFRVLDVADDKIRVVGLTSSYQHGIPTVRAVKKTLKSTQKTVIVMPPNSAMALFMRIEDGMTEPDDHIRAAKWLHGSYQFEDLQNEF